MPLFASKSSQPGQTESKPEGSPKGPNRDSKSASSSGSPGRSGSMLSRFREMSSDSSAGFVADPTIKAARQKVTDAEQAERDADRALDVARRAVREACQHVKNLELAAVEEARRAHAKQREAKSIRKGADRLGRHN